MNNLKYIIGSLETAMKVYEDPNESDSFKAGYLGSCLRSVLVQLVQIQEEAEPEHEADPDPLGVLDLLDEALKKGIKID